MTMFCTVDDVKRMIRDREGESMIEIGNNPGDDISIDDVERFIESDAEYIITRLAKTPSRTAMVRDINASLTAYAIWIHVVIGSRGGDIPEFVQAWKAQAEERLDELFMAGDMHDQIAPGGVITMRSTGFKSMRWEPVVLKKYEYSRLSRGNIILRTISAYKDETEQEVYQVGVDFELNSRTGEIRRLPNTKIDDGQKILVSYHYIDKGRFKDSPGSIRWGGGRSGGGYVY